MTEPEHISKIIGRVLGNVMRRNEETRNRVQEIRKLALCLSVHNNDDRLMNELVGLNN